MRRRLSPTADVPSHTSGASYGQMRSFVSMALSTMATDQSMQRSGPGKNPETGLVTPIFALVSGWHREVDALLSELRP